MWHTRLEGSHHGHSAGLQAPSKNWELLVAKKQV